MGRKLNLSHLSEEECEQILRVLQKDFELRQKEKERIGAIEATLNNEKNKTHVLSQQTKFNKNCCIRCCQVFGLIFNRRRQCYACGYNVCRDCCDYDTDSKNYVCHFCAKEKTLPKQTGSWFYNTVSQRFRRFGSAKVVRSLYKHTSYSDTELDRGAFDPAAPRDLHRPGGRHPKLSDVFGVDGNEGDDDDDENDDVDDDELPTQSTTVRSPTTRTASTSRPVSRAGSVDTLNLLSSSSFSTPISSPSSRQQRSRTPDPIKPRGGDAGRSRGKDPARPLSRESETYKGRLKKDTKDIYKHAFDSARKAEEYKFKAKFDLLLSDLRRTLDRKSPNGLSDSFASTSYGEVMLSFRGRVKDLLVGFSQRLQLAYESFENNEPADDRVQQVKQNVSRFVEDILGESLDLTSDEAVSDLSSLSDDSASDRHSFEDQIAQAVVSKILENHRREVSSSLGTDRRRGSHLSSASLVPGEDDDEEDDVDGQSPAASDFETEKANLAKDFEDLKNFVRETQSWTRPSYDVTEDDDSSPSSDRTRASSFDSGYSRERDPPLPDFSEFDHLDFNSGELDPDLLQMNLAVIPEETEEELEQEASDVSDTHWRENWIFKGTAPSAYDHVGKKRIRGDGDDTPQYMMVPRPEDHHAPKVGNRDVDQLSDLSDNEDLTDDDNSFYPGTSEELARISRHKRSSAGDISDQEPPRQKKPTLAPENLDVDVDFEDVSVGTEDFVGPIVQPSKQQLKLLEDLVPADDDDPKFVLPPESVTIQEGEPVKFSCRVAGTQPIDVFWYREHEEVEELEEGEDVELGQDGDKHTATIHNVARAHAGQYMAIALSDTGKAIKYLTVTVKENKQELKKPEFLKELKDVEVLEGQSVKFRCKVKGYPQPRINWYKDGVLLKGSKSCRIEKFGNRDYILTIDWATMDDDAEYMVVARNVAGQVKSTAQVIVEPDSDEHALRPTKPRSLSLTSTLTTDSSDTERPSSARQLQRDGPKLESLAHQVAVARQHMRQEAEDMLVTAEELTALNQHLDEMERHLDSLEGCTPSHSPSEQNNNVDYAKLLDETAAQRMIEDDKEMEESAKKVRKLTSNALSVLRAAEEIIQTEKEMASNFRASSPPPSPPLPQHASPSSSISAAEEENNNKMSTASFTFTDSLVGNRAVETGSDRCVNDSPVTEHNLSPLKDDFSLDLPSLEDDYLSQDSSSYREEVSISLSSSKADRTSVNRVQQQQQRPGLSGAGSSLYGGANSSSKGDRPTNSATSETDSSSTSSTSTVRSSSGRFSMSAKDETDTPMTRSDVTLDSMADSGLVLNFGPKEANRQLYGRDYEMAHKASGEAGERKRWSVTLDPFSADAEVVNRQPSLDETEEKIYLTAGKMFNLEDRVRELESRVQVQVGGSAGPVHSLADLEDQVSKTAAQVARSEKEVTGIERALTTLQFSPRSSRGSNSSTSSTPRESIDSGVSSFTPERVERPQPVHMVGQTQEEDMPESRAEYDADSGVELPSVSRLRAMFGKRRDDDLGEGNFKRIHSITARSVPKEQLQKLRESWYNPPADVVRVKNQTVKSRSTLQLQGNEETPETRPPPRPTGSEQSSTARISLSQVGSRPQEKVVPRVQRNIRTGNLPEPAKYRQLDPANEPVLIYPEEEAQLASVAVRLNTVARPGKVGAANAATTTTTTAAAHTTATPSSSAAAESEGKRLRVQSTGHAEGSQDNAPVPKIRSGCISARAAFWERRIMQGEATDENVEEDFPEMVQGSSA